MSLRDAVLEIAEEMEEEAKKAALQSVGGSPLLSYAKQLRRCVKAAGEETPKAKELGICTHPGRQKGACKCKLAAKCGTCGLCERCGRAILLPTDKIGPKIDPMELLREDAEERVEMDWVDPKQG